MTDTPDSPDTSEPTTVPPTADTDPAPAAGADAEPSGEAAKYRRRLRETETQRDTYAARLDVLERDELARMATSGDGPRVYDAADIFGPQTDLDALRADDGTLDPDKVAAAVQEATQGRAHLRADGKPRPPRPNPAQSAPARSDRPATTRGEAWSDALARR